MPLALTKSDSLREYLTGAGADGASQANPSLSLGNFRSSIEAVSLGIEVFNAISGVTALYAGGKNPTGVGQLTAIDEHSLTWQPAGDANPGAPVTWVDNLLTTQIVESLIDPGKYLRVSAIAPFTPGLSQILLTDLYNNIFGFDTLTPTQASAGSSNYRATMLRNESASVITQLSRWLTLLGTQRVSNSAQLGGAGAGTITSTGSLADWPVVGFCQVRTNTGTLKEVVYYTVRTLNSLTVPAVGRGLLGTVATAGSATDLIYPVSGVALGIDSAGVQAFGASIQTIANQTTAPAGITWNLGVTLAGGVQIPTMNPNQEVGIWVWRQMPAGSVAMPGAPVRFSDSFSIVI